MKGTTFLQRLKPYLLAMSLDYSVVPYCDINIVTSLLADGEHNRGRDAQGRIEMALTNALAKAEHNPAEDVAIDLEFGGMTLNGSAEGNVGHDVTALAWLLGVSLEGNAGVSQGRFAKDFTAFMDTYVGATGLRANRRDCEEADASVNADVDAEAHSSLARQMTLTQDTQFTLNMVAQAFEIAIKKVQDALSEVETTPLMEVEATPTESVEMMQESLVEFIANLRRTNGRRAVVTKDITTQLTMVVEKFRRAILNDTAGKSITAFFGNKTIDRATLILTT